MKLVQKWDLSRKPLLYAMRAREFRDALSEDEYIQRNGVIYLSSFAKDHIHTYVLIDEEGTLCASCELLEVEFGVRVAEGVESRKGTLFASVLTPPEQRGNGYASHLMKEVMQIRAEDHGLFSDIDPSYYEKMGFHCETTSEYVIPAENFPKQTQIANAISLSAFHAGLIAFRNERLREMAASQVMFLPMLAFLEWHLERYRFYHSVRGRRLTHEPTWKSGCGHLLFAVPNPITQSLDCLWCVSNCAECMKVIGTLVSEHQLKSATLWASAAPMAGLEPHQKKPMLRISGISKPRLADTQPCDYW